MCETTLVLTRQVLEGKTAAVVIFASVTVSTLNGGYICIEFSHLVFSGNQEETIKLEPIEYKEEIEASGHYFNHKYYTFLESDWFKKTCIFY